MSDGEGDNENSSASEFGDESTVTDYNDFRKHVEKTRSEEITLPETINLIETEDKCQLYVVGTSHFSEESVKDVEYVFDKRLPDYIVIELCRNRTQMLHMDEDEIKKQMATINVTKFIKRYGASSGIMHYLMLRMSAYIMENIGSAPGGEFRAAYNKAENLPYCQVYLGDRPVTITFKRALASLGPWAKFKLFITLLRGLQPITKEQMEEMKKADLLEQLMRELAGDYPEISRVFVTERDEYLTRAIWEVAKPITLPDNRTVPSVGIAVVGIGHMAGIRKLWLQADTISKAELCKIPPPTLSSRVFSYSVRLSLLGAVMYSGIILVRKFCPNLLWP